MSNRPIHLLLEDIFEAAEKVIRYTDGLAYETFTKDDKSIDAVVRNLEIIGEAVRRLPEDFKEKYPDVEWEKIVGLRHRIVHDYFGIDLEIIWRILQKDLPEFRNILAKLR